MSSNVSDVKREGDDVVVTFKSGDRYRYVGVPDEVYVELRRAESQGSFLAKNLRGRYRTEKLGGER